MATARYWRENPSRYNLVASKCGVCGRVFLPPRAVCSNCHRKSIGKMQPLQLKGEGEVFSFTTVYDAPSQFEMLKPYVMAMVKMDEGTMLTSQLIDAEPGEIKIGMRVKATLRKVGEDGEAGVIYYGYKFKPI
ncbi:MAG TPA: Zn-ribbon domain-containing OB-fold protein [Methanomassiliicoccales archaeon]|nr:Zn-ribbon domain-containing OB-fold protein [Methanomassiliicoccales archaeon]HXZ23360.1 Zn-ribbon domain-containing OB-fold protein [Methanomassiliicoccales archaeon]